MSDSCLKPFFTYYGGKWRVSNYYPKPKYNTIVEPFAGGAGYALRYSNLDVVLIEKNPKLAATWRYLIRANAAEILSLPLLSDGQSVDDLPVHEEARYLIGWNLNKGSTTPSKTPSAWMRTCNPQSISQFWSVQRRDRIARQVEKIKHWKIIESDYADSPDITATWFIDPPYIGAGKHYPEQPADFSLLGDWCRTRKGQAIVCENEGASWLPFQPFRNIKANNSKNGGKVSKEAIWYNEQSP